MGLLPEKRYNRPLFDPPKRRPLLSVPGPELQETVIGANQRSCLLASDRCKNASMYSSDPVSELRATVTRPRSAKI
jgi:hypothetical protein